MNSLLMKNLMKSWKELKAEKLIDSTKYILKYAKQEKLTTYFYDVWRCV